jgi:hypothetical protein
VQRRGRKVWGVGSEDGVKKSGMGYEILASIVEDVKQLSEFVMLAIALLLYLIIAYYLMASMPYMNRKQRILVFVAIVATFSIICFTIF